jgi:hypothetical protein
MSAPVVDYSNDTVYVGVPDRIVGSVMRAPLGAALPTDATTAPDPAFVGCGYITENGATLADAQTWTEIKDWGGDIVRRIKSLSNVTVKTEFLEINPESAKVAFGDANVTVTPGTASTGGLMKININVSQPARASYIFNILDGVRHMRIVIADGQVTERGDSQFTRTAAVIVPVTIAAAPDQDGNTVVIYTDDGIHVGP